jgi:hypothetical protein
VHRWVWCEELKEIGGRTILKWIFKTQDGEAWTGLIWLRIGQVVGSCECSHKPSGSIKCWKFLDY